LHTSHFATPAHHLCIHTSFALLVHFLTDLGYFSLPLHPTPAIYLLHSPHTARSAGSDTHCTLVCTHARILLPHFAAPGFAVSRTPCRFRALVRCRAHSCSFASAGFIALHSPDTRAARAPLALLPHCAPHRTWSVAHTLHVGFVPRIATPRTRVYLGISCTLSFFAPAHTVATDRFAPLRCY